MMGLNVKRSKGLRERYAEDNRDLEVETISSARRLVPLIYDLIQPSSVVDIGCGIGAFLAEFQAHGVDDILGIDWPAIDRSSILIPEAKFLPRDLSEGLNPERRFDLALCLEVGEHLESEKAMDLVRSLVGYSDVVAFSAAIPYQTGTHHVNEQWPSYWWRLFRQFEYSAWDPFRLRTWDDDEVLWWYSQNLVLYARAGTHLAGVEQLTTSPPALVHPECYYLWTAGRPTNSIKGAVSDLKNALKSRLIRN